MNNNRIILFTYLNQYFNSHKSIRDDKFEFEVNKHVSDWKERKKKKINII